MCIICYLPEGSTISVDEFEECWRSNSHGFGFSYVNGNNKLVIAKTLDEKEAKEMFFETFDRFKDTTPFLLHFRIKTHGDKHIDNTHPFMVNDRLTMCHNGVISKCTPRGKDERSDTRIFAEDMLRKLPDGFLRNPAIVEFISDYIGGSKLAFMDSRRGVDIINAHHGVKDGDRWFSNSSFRKSVPSTYSAAAGYRPSTNQGTTQSSSKGSGTGVVVRSAAGEAALAKALNREACETDCTPPLITPTKVPWDDEKEAELAAEYEREANARRASTTCFKCSDVFAPHLFFPQWGMCKACLLPILDFLDANPDTVKVVKDLWDENAFLFDECMPLDECPGLIIPDTSFACVHYKLEPEEMELVNKRILKEIANLPASSDLSTEELDEIAAVAGLS